MEILNIKSVDITDKNNVFTVYQKENGFLKKVIKYRKFYSDCCHYKTKDDQGRGYPICSKCEKVCGYLKRYLKIYN